MSNIIKSYNNTQDQAGKDLEKGGDDVECTMGWWASEIMNAKRRSLFGGGVVQGRKRIFEVVSYADYTALKSIGL